jgi:hypothetical protein
MNFSQSNIIINAIWKILKFEPENIYISSQITYTCEIQGDGWMEITFFNKQLLKVNEVKAYKNLVNNTK